MRSVGLKVLKNKLSEYVRLQVSGERVLVTDRDRVVAEIVAPSSGRSVFLSDAMLADAVRQGVVTPPAVVRSEVPVRTPLISLDELLADLGRDRADP
jgi:antitoxin (DNA-binding transcriptional repressor) of toxin-antitoxin stability system